MVVGERSVSEFGVDVGGFGGLWCNSGVRLRRSESRRKGSCG